jgi:hypothetical protein
MFKNKKWAKLSVITLYTDLILCILIIIVFSLFIKPPLNNCSSTGIMCFGFNENNGLTIFFLCLITNLISIVIHTYNNSLGITALYLILKSVLESLKPFFEYEIIFVNDFSTDLTI